MQRLSTLLSFLLVLLIGSRCTPVAPEATPQVFLSADHNDSNARWTAECAFRYTIANTFPGLDPNSQREAIQAGIGVWQRLCRNINFLEFATADRAMLTVRFVGPEQMGGQSVPVGVGLISGSAGVTATIRPGSNDTYTLLLRNDYNWNTNTLSRAVAYHIGLLLGVATSSDKGSLMSTVLQNQLLRHSQADSIAVNRLYLTPCGNYMPISFPVSDVTTKTIKFDKQGTVQITATGQINVGPVVGVSSPEGKTEGGFLGWSLASYSIVPTMFHAALMYRINDEKTWRYCGRECSFSTAGNQSVNLTFDVNDNTKSDNSGAYNVTIQYR